MLVFLKYAIILYRLNGGEDNIADKQLKETIKYCVLYNVFI